MNTASDAADQVVKMTLNGTEMALRVSGKGAVKVTGLLVKAMKSAARQERKTKGSMRLNNLVRSGKKLDVIEVKDENLKQFCTEAKKYGIVYTILKDRDANDGTTEIMYKSEDKEKIGRVLGKLHMTAVDFARVKDAAAKEEESKQVPNRDGKDSEVEAEQFMSKLMEKDNPTKEAGQTQNPTLTRTEKSGPSVSSSKLQTMTSKDCFEAAPEERRSVREELKEIGSELERARRAENERSPKSPTKTNEHKHVPKKKPEKER